MSTNEPVEFEVPPPQVRDVHEALRRVSAPDPDYNPCTLDLTEVADVLRHGDQFDVVTVGDDGDISVETGRVVDQFQQQLDERMGMFAAAGEKIARSGAIHQDYEVARRSFVNSRRTPAEQKRAAKAKAKFKAQKRARKKQRRK